MTKTQKNLLYLFAYFSSEITAYSIYSGHRASFHWFTHFFVGGSIALLAMAIWMSRTRRPVRYPLFWLYLCHIFALVPDLLFDFAHTPHERWMDIFFGHISTHFVPGRNWTWYVVFMLSLGLYLWVVGKTNQKAAKSTVNSA